MSSLTIFLTYYSNCKLKLVSPFFLSKTMFQFVSPIGMMSTYFAGFTFLVEFHA